MWVKVTRYLWCMYTPHNFVNRPSFKNLIDIFLPNVQRYPDCFYILKLTPSGRAEIQNSRISSFLDILNFSSAPGGRGKCRVLREQTDMTWQTLLPNARCFSFMGNIKSSYGNLKPVPVIVRDISPWVIKNSCTRCGSRKWHHKLGITIEEQKLGAGWFLTAWCFL